MTGPKKLTHEIVHKRDDGSRVKITSTLSTSSSFSATAVYMQEVHICAPKKRTWLTPHDPNCHGYRALGMRERAKFRKVAALLVVTQEELDHAAICLWEQIKP